MQAISKHIIIVSWNLQNIYLAKHLRMLDSTHKKTVFMQYLKIASLSARINKIPNTLLLVQS